MTGPRLGIFDWLLPDYELLTWKSNKRVYPHQVDRRLDQARHDRGQRQTATTVPGSWSVSSGRIGAGHTPTPERERTDATVMAPTSTTATCGRLT